jgi:hypothetical protein
MAGRYNVEVRLAGGEVLGRREKVYDWRAGAERIYNEWARGGRKRVKRRAILDPRERTNGFHFKSEAGTKELLIGHWLPEAALVVEVTDA